MINCGQKRRLKKGRKFNTLHINNDFWGILGPAPHLLGPELLSDVIGYDKSKAIELTGEPLQMKDCELPVWKDEDHKIEAGGIMTGDALQELTRDVPIITHSAELAGKGEFFKLKED